MSKIVIDESGVLELIYNDELRSLLSEGAAAIARASHVEPTAEGHWTADLSPSNGPVLGPFDTRAEALAAEVQWLEVNRL